MAPDVTAERAARIAGSLRPSRVLDVSGDADLQAALDALGIEVAGPSGTEDAGFDLVLCLDAVGDVAQAKAVLERHGKRAPRLLLSLDRARHGAAASLLDWLLVAAACGLHPVIAYDASYINGDTMLLERGAVAMDVAMLAACVEIARARYSIGRREQAMAARAQGLRDRLRRADTARADDADKHASLAERLRSTEASLAVARHERDALLNSTIWRLSYPLRRAMNLVSRRGGRASGTGADVTAYQDWVAAHDTLSEAQRDAIRAHVGRMTDPPLISVVMPAYDTPEDLLRAAVASVQAQLYPHWELCVADDGSPSPKVAAVLAELAAAETRLRWVRLAVNGNISAATNAALALATGAFVALMDHDDLLPEHALYEIAAELEAYPQADIVYSDEDQIDLDGRRALPYFKPDYNLELMLAHNMVSHLGVYRRSLIERIGGARLGLEGSQDYDIALRAMALTEPRNIRHVPAVLYHWRQHRTSFSKERIDACVRAARQAIADYLAAAGLAPLVAEIGPSPAIAAWSRVRWRLPDPAPRVSIIVPTRDGAEMLRQCADGLLRRTDYPDLELIIADNDSQLVETEHLLAELRQDPRVRVLRCPGAFNFSAINNQAAAVATGSMLALVNNDIDVIEPGWLAEMVSQACRPGIGAVGARLLYADGRVQHTGVVLGVGTFDGGPGVAGHFSLADAGSSFGYFGASVLVHEVSAVTAACMVLRKDAYQAVGGMDAEHLAVAFNDVDLCLRLREAGLRNIFTPHAELYHLESASRGDDLSAEHGARFERECRYMRERWGEVLDRDPFYNPNFSRIDGLFRLSSAPRRSGRGERLLDRC